MTERLAVHAVTTASSSYGACEAVLAVADDRRVAVRFQDGGTTLLELSIGAATSIWGSSASSMIVTETGTRTAVVWDSKAVQTRFSQVVHDMLQQSTVLLDLVDDDATDAPQSSKEDDEVAHFLAMLKDKRVLDQIRRLHRALVARWGPDWLAHLTAEFPILWEF